MGRCVLICGASGCGKSTTAEGLAERAGASWSHFDGDSWMYGRDPIAHAGQLPTPEQLAACPAEIAALRDGFVNQYWMPLAQGGAADFAAVEAFYTGMASAVEAARGDSDIVLSHAVFERRTRDLLRRLVPGVEMAVLDVADAELVRRKKHRLTEQAAEKGQSVEDFVMAYPGEGSAEERIDNLTNSKSNIASDPVQPDEEGTVSIAVAEEDTAAVVRKVGDHFGLLCTNP